MGTPETLVKQLQESDLPTQITAAESLARLAEEAQPAIVALVQHCGSEDEDLRNWSTAALEQIGAPTKEQIDASHVIGLSGYCCMAKFTRQ